MSFISVRNLTHKYIIRDENDQVLYMKTALENISLDIDAGEFVVVLGRNGSGKSTLAKHLNGILLPTEGEVKVMDMDTKDDGSILEIRKNVGMVFQNPDNQIIANVVEEDVAFGPENIGVPTEEIWQRVDEALTAVDMKAYRLRSPNKLSGGQKQRVAIAGVMAMRPKCIILDESTAMLDPDGRRDVLNTIKRLNKEEGITVVFITHYMDEAAEADRVVVMDNGRILIQGTPRQVFSDPELMKKSGLDVPQVTELAEKLIQGGIDLPRGIITIEELISELKSRKH